MNHPSTLSTKNRMTIYFQELGKYDGAMESFFEVNKINTLTL